MLNIAANILSYINLLLIPFFFIYRIKKEGFRVVLNPVYVYLFCLYFYSVLFSYSLLCPNLFLIPNEIMSITDLYTNLFVMIVFVLACVFGNRVKNITFQFRIPTVTYQIAVMLIIIVSAYYLLIYALHLKGLLAMEGRMQRVVYYNNHIFIGGRFITLNIFYFLSIAIVAWKKNNPKFFLLGLLPMSSEIIAFGRIDLIKWGIFSYINIVCMKKKLYLKTASLVFVLILSIGLIRFNTFNPINFFGEFYTGRVITDYAYIHHSEAGSDLLELFSLTFRRLVPSFISASLGQDKPEELFVATIQREYIPWSAGSNVLAAGGSAIAGSIIGESVFYGGGAFAIITAFISFAFFQVFNFLQRSNKISLFLISTLVSSQAVVATRTDFYPLLFGTLYIYSAYFLWIYFWEFCPLRRSRAPLPEQGAPVTISFLSTSSSDTKSR